MRIRVSTARKEPAFRAGMQTLQGKGLPLLLAGLGMFLVSAAAPTAPAAEGKQWRLDDFSRTFAPNEPFGTWGLKKVAPFFGDGERTFFQFVHEGPEKHYIHLMSGKDNSFTIGLQEDFRVQDWPVLEWEWKVTLLPRGGDVRVKENDDQAGSICVIVNPGLFGFKSLCYLWENDGPKDTPITSRKRDDSRYLILRTGKQDGAGAWYKQRRDILKDYVRVFGEEPQEKAIIGMQIDSDSTSSAAEVFYRNIYLRGP